MIDPIFCREKDSFDDIQLKLDLSTQDIKELVLNKIIVEQTSKHYIWNIVGFVVIKSYPITVFPELYKYEDTSIGKDDALILLQVFQRYCHSSKLTSEEMQYLLGVNGRDESNISLSLYFFQDFKNYGLLNRFKSKNQTSKIGLINWNKTTTQQIPVTTHHSAFYPTPFVRLKHNNINSLIRRLHEWILDDASKKWGWLDGNFEYKMLSAFPCENLEEAILILKKELRTTFLQREIKLIKNMIAYLTNTASLKDSLIYDYYYTSSFYHIWEIICGYAFKNDYDRLSELYIPKTIVHFTNTEKKDLYRKQIPDILFIKEKRIDTKNTFCIFDAKYYKYGEFPGWHDIMKQYVYYMTIKERLNKDGLDYNIVNAFLLPGKVSSIERCAIVKTENMPDFGKIIAYYINVETIMHIYIQEEDFNSIESIFTDLEI